MCYVNSVHACVCKYSFRESVRIKLYFKVTNYILVLLDHMLLFLFTKITNSYAVKLLLMYSLFLGYLTVI